MRILSFDCANKSLAVCGINVRDDAIANILLQINKLSNEVREIKTIINLNAVNNVAEKKPNVSSTHKKTNNARRSHLGRTINVETIQLDSESSNLVAQKWALLVSQLPKLVNTFLSIWQLEYQKSFDLLPGKKVSETGPTERCVCLKSAIEIIKSDYYTKNKCDYVVIEDQMNINEKSRGVFYCLIYEFGHIARPIKAYEKNKLALGGHYRCDFLAKYASSWSANKAHSRANFLVIASELKYPVPKKCLADIADAYFQAIAFMIYC